MPMRLSNSSSFQFAYFSFFKGRLEKLTWVLETKNSYHKYTVPSVRHYPNNTVILKYYAGRLGSIIGWFNIKLQELGALAETKLH